MNNKATILLLGGTSETAPLAQKLVAASYRVLVSTATDAPLDIGNHPAIRRRCGRLNHHQLAALIEEHHIVALVDATHPYASEVHQIARQVALQTKRPYLRYQRSAMAENITGKMPESILTAQPGWIAVANHQEAAQHACSIGKPVLLTTGSRHLAPYIAEAKRQQVPLLARVLDHPESIAACNAAGLAEKERIFGRGPFSLEQNLKLIRQHKIKVIVTKDSGRAGGVQEKLAAAKRENCLLIVVQRPPEAGDNRFASMDKLITALQQLTNNTIQGASYEG